MPHHTGTMTEPIIDEALSHRLIHEATNPDPSRVREVLAKARELKGLDLADTAILLNITDDDLMDELFAAAHAVKDEIYGSRLVMFAPLYVSNHCSNNCLYCGFRHDNKDMKRTALTLDDIREEVSLILKQGHKRILMLMGEHPTKCAFDFFLEAVDAAYTVTDGQSSIRRINVEIAPLTNEEFARLKQVKIGTYTVFQETYHRETYAAMHPIGIKRDYDWRITVMDRAMTAGIDDVGIGALFGLYDYRFEVLGLLQHARHLDSHFGAGPHTISIPRIEYASGAPAAVNPPAPVSDRDFRKLVATIRLAVPYTGMILSTRERPELRQQLLDLGISQISAGSKTTPGGYHDAGAKDASDGQFTLNDTRATGEVIRDVIRRGFVPSFCTGCYRKGRTGQDFMDLAKPGLIKLFCLPNALVTLKEYLVDYADPDTRREGEALIEREIANIPKAETAAETRRRLERIEHGERDLYF